MKTTVEILTAARELLSVPERWTKGSPARTSDGTMTDARSEDAVCWCARGALQRVSDCCDEVYASRAILRQATGNYGFKDYVYLNDLPKTTHADILSLFDRAIELARKKANV